MLIKYGSAYVIGLFGTYAMQTIQQLLTVAKGMWRIRLRRWLKQANHSDWKLTQLRQVMVIGAHGNIKIDKSKIQNIGSNTLVLLSKLTATAPLISRL